MNYSRKSKYSLVLESCAQNMGKIVQINRKLSSQAKANHKGNILRTESVHFPPTSATFKT